LATTVNSIMHPQGSSQLSVLRDTVYFAYPTEPDGRDFPRRGTVVLRGSGATWVSDTIRGSNSPSGVGLVADPTQNRVVAAIVEQPRVNRRSLASAILLSSYGGRWSTPRHMAGDGIDPVESTPSVGIVGTDRTFLSWSTANMANGSGMRVEWTVVGPDSNAPRHPPVATGAGAQDNVAIVLDTNRVVWIGRDGMTRDRLRLSVGDTRTATQDLGTLPISIDNPRPWSIRLSPSTFATVTSRLAASPNDLVVSTIVSRIQVNCK
jgi:hypothetical protein